MDNTRILRPKESIEANFDGNIRILYNAPYYPDLNPIENFFSGLKKKNIYNNFMLKLKKIY
jgi:transposase